MITIFGIQFGKPFPATAKIEEQRKKLILDYERYNSIEASATYLRFRELAEIVGSGAFEKRVVVNKNFKYKESSTYLKVKKFKSLKGLKVIKSYQKSIRRELNLDKLVEISNSHELARFIELEKIISTPEFTQKLQEPGFESSEAGKMALEFQQLQSNPDIILFKKNGETAEFKEMMRLMNSTEVKDFIALELEITSEDFKKLDAEYADKNRFKKSQEYLQLVEYEGLKKSDDIVWYTKHAPKDQFAQLTEWKTTFEEDFDATRLDNSKWMTSYYWGQAILNDSYVTSDDKQIFKQNNVVLRDSKVRIETISESCTGKVWDAEKGFYVSNFNYSSGMVNNGHAFRQACGKIEAKVRFSEVGGLTQAFWLCGETNAPHINIFKSTGKKGELLEIGKFVKNGGKISSNLKTLAFKNLGSEFHIYTLEWSKERIVWKINDVVVAEQTDNIPHEAMYVNFSSHLKSEIGAEKLPAYLEIDWVKCFSKR